MSHPLQVPPEPPSDDSAAPSHATASAERQPSGRLFVFDPGWQIAIKANSLREFCTTMAPGQDYYHTLLANEIYVHEGTEKLCLNCAIRRGIVVFEPKKLREAVVIPRTETEPIPIDVESGRPGGDSGTSGRPDPLL